MSFNLRILSLKKYSININKLLLLCFLFFVESTFAINETKTVGSTGADFTTLKAAFDAINNGSLTGSVTLKITSSTTETTSAVLNASGSGSASYTALLVYPTVTGLSVSGNISGPLIDLNGADNVTIDGRINAVGSTRSLVLDNTNNTSSTGVSTIRFVNSAINNNVQYCVVRGSELSATSGVVFLSSSTLATGNSNNTIINNSITASSDLNRPVNGVYSEGNPASANVNVVISNNSIYNVLNRNLNSYAVNINAGSDGFIVSSNSFYETADFVPASNSSYTFVQINNSSAGGFQVMNNFIGGRADLGAGGTMKKTNAYSNSFTGISISANTGNVSYINGNKISSLSWENSTYANWTGILVNSGDVELGSLSPNSIGESSGTGTINVKQASLGGVFSAIQILSQGTVNCKKNIIGSISSTNSSKTVGIYLSSISGAATINDNRIGSSISLNSIEELSSPLDQTQFLSGIFVQGSGTNTIVGNSISNLNSASKGSGYVCGIDISSGTNTVRNNLVSRIYSYSSGTTSPFGISVIGTSYNNLLEGNEISKLENRYTKFQGSVVAIQLQCSGSTTVNKNFIHSVLIDDPNPNTSIIAVKSNEGPVLFMNNIILLGGAKRSSIFGIYDNASQSSVYNNTIYIDGNPTVGTENSYALYCASNLNNQNIRNNVFANQRSNSGATGSHYAAYFNYFSSPNLTLDYNLYYTDGVGGYPGFAGTNKTTLPFITGTDAAGVIAAPGFQNASGTATTDYKLVYSKYSGVSITQVTEDFGSVARPSAPTIGAWEFAGENMWKGSVSSVWSDSRNWTKSVVPIADADIEFDPNPMNDLVMDINQSVGNVTISQSVYKLVLNGLQLTLKGDFDLSNGAKIDATAANSKIVYSGSSVQNLNADHFVDNKVFYVTINNTSNVLLSGNLVVLGSLNKASGFIDAYSNNNTLTYKGSVMQQIPEGLFKDSILNALIVDNPVELRLNSSIVVNSDVQILANSKFVLSPTARLKVNGSLVNNAGVSGLTLNSTVSGTASLVHNTNNVQATVKRYMGGTVLATDRGDWHFYSSPVGGQTIGGDWKPAGRYGDGTGYDLYVWNEPSACWVYNLNTTVAPTWASSHPSSDFITGKGYLYAVDTIKVTKTSTGILHNSNISINVTADGVTSKKGFNLIGNPYPSSIDWKNDAGFNRSVLEQISGGYPIWVWTSSDNYGVYNSADNTGTHGVSRYISPAMGFFVLAKNSGTFTFRNDARVHNQASNWIRVKAVNTKPVLRLRVSSPVTNGSDEVLLFFERTVTENGAEKIFSSVVSAPSLYITSSNAKLSTFYVSEQDADNSQSLSFMAGVDGRYTLQMEDYEDNVLLEDLLLDKVIDLRETGEYTFDAKKTDKPERFKLHFSEISRNELALGLLTIFTNEQKIHINASSVSGNYKYKLIDTNGQAFSAGTIVGGSVTSIPVQRKSVFFMQLFNEQESRIVKLLN